MSWIGALALIATLATGCFFEGSPEHDEICGDDVGYNEGLLIEVRNMEPGLEYGYIVTADGTEVEVGWRNGDVIDLAEVPLDGGDVLYADSASDKLMIRRVRDGVALAAPSSVTVASYEYEAQVAIDTFEPEWSRDYPWGEQCEGFNSAYETIQLPDPP